MPEADRAEEAAVTEVAGRDGQDLSAEDAAQDAAKALPGLPAALTDAATAEDYAAAAAIFRRHADAAEAAAADAEARAQQIDAEARAEIERITRETQAETNRLRWTVARSARDDAGKHRDRGAYLADAAGRKAQAAEAVQRGLDLAQEREGLAERAEELEGRLGELDASQRGLEQRLAGAREAGDAAAITSLRGEIAGHAEAREVLAGQLAGTRARMDAIGTDAGTGELFDALNAARRDTAEARRLVNLAYPERPEAVADRSQAELLAVLQGNADRIAEEWQAAQQPKRQAVIRT